jgi:hypothetical protein
VDNNVGIGEANHENPVTPTLWSGGRALMKETYGHGKARRKTITKALEGPIAVKDSPDVVISGCPHLCGWVGGVSVLENRSQIVIISIKPQKSLGPQVLDGHGTAAGEAHTIAVARTAVNLKVVLWNV